MTELKIHQQIAALRKSQRMTQEQLAQALGVTNQTVSKWESAQCCPDIALLPRIAALFDVTVDTLLGCTPSLPEAQESALQSAALLHLSVLNHFSPGNGPHTPHFLSPSAKEHAIKGSWGYSCLHTPSVTTTMRGGTVFFSDNRLPQSLPLAAHRLSALLAPFSDPNTLRVFAALYLLTVDDETSGAMSAQIADRAKLPAETVQALLHGALLPYLSEVDSGLRISGMYMNLLPILSLLDYQ